MRWPGHAGLHDLLRRAPASRGQLTLFIAVESVSSTESNFMMDVLFLALTAVLFSLTWGLTRLCDSV
jgi:hypothetical protein